MEARIRSKLELQRSYDEQLRLKALRAEQQQAQEAAFREEMLAKFAEDDRYCLFSFAVVIGLCVCGRACHGRGLVHGLSHTLPRFCCGTDPPSPSPKVGANERAEAADEAGGAPAGGGAFGGGAPRRLRSGG